MDAEGNLGGTVRKDPKTCTGSFFVFPRMSETPRPDDFLTRLAAEPAVADEPLPCVAELLMRLREYSPEVRSQVRRLERLTRQAALDKALQGR